jgi:hypothetical protein
MAAEGAYFAPKRAESRWANTSRLVNKRPGAASSLEKLTAAPIRNTRRRCEIIVTYSPPRFQGAAATATKGRANIMTEPETKMFRQFILMRVELVFNRLKENQEYRELYERQRKTSADVDAILDKLSKDERLTIRRHYEGETNKESYLLSGMYLQGLHDSVKVLSFLMFDSEVCL